MTGGDTMMDLALKEAEAAAKAKAESLKASTVRTSVTVVGDPMIRAGAPFQYRDVRPGVDGIEFIVDENGRAFTDDVNTNTNYNPDAEAKDGRAGTARSGMGAVASYLGGLLAQQTGATASPREAALA